MYEDWGTSGIEKWVTVPVYKPDDRVTDVQLLEWILDRVKGDLYTVTEKPMHPTEPYSVSFPAGKSSVTGFAVYCLQSRLIDLTGGACQIDRKYLFRERCMQ